MAYYPYTTTLTDGYKLNVDVTDQSNLPAIDLMAADRVKGVSEKNPKVTLTFAHKLSKVVVTVDRNTSAAAIDLAGAKVELKGVATKAVYSLTDDVLTPEAATGVTIPVTLTDGILGGTAIVIPAAAGSGVALALTTADGRTFTSPLASTDALAPGTENILRMHLGQTAAELTLNIKPWTPGIDATATVNLNSITAGGMTGNLTSATGDQITLGVEGLTAVYTYNGNAWSTPTPIYWEDLTEQQQTFSLFYSPAADAVEPNEKDYLYGTADIAFGEPVSATLGHLMAQLEVTITSAYFSDALLNAATVELQNILPVSDIDAATGAVTPGAAVKKTMNGTAANATHTLTLAPQTFAADATLAIVTLDGSTYTVKPGDITVTENGSTGRLTALEAGKRYKITLTVNVTVSGTEVSVSATLADWVDVTGSGEMTPDVE